MLKVFWFILWIGTIVFFISYLKIRDRIPTSKRDTFEKCLMALMIIFLIVNVGLLVREHRNTSMEINDCIRFYRYLPLSYDDSEFYFINKWCYVYFNEEEIQRLKDSGFNWRQREGISGGISGISDLMKGGNLIIKNG